VLPPLEGTAGARAVNLVIRWLARFWLNRQAAVALILGRKAAARGLFEQMVSLNPDDAIALSSLGNLRMEAGDSVGAVSALVDLVGRRPMDANAWFNLGYVYEKRDELVDAERCMREAVRVNPRHDRAWYGLALVLIRMGALTQAVDALEKNIALQPLSPYGFYQLGMTLHHLGRAEQAQRMVDRLRQFEPKYAATLERDIQRTVPQGLAAGDATGRSTIPVTDNPDAMRGTT
jgi:tetratricopeptide (TPR) repeat protein